MVSVRKHEKASASRESTVRRECRPALYLGFRKISFTASVLPKKNNKQKQNTHIIESRQLSVGVEGRSVLSAVHVVSVPYPKM